MKYLGPTAAAQSRRDDARSFRRQDTGAVAKLKRRMVARERKIKTMIKKTHKAIPRRSRRMSEAMKMYKQKRKWFLIEHPICQACKMKPSEDIHHIRGRIGPLFVDERFFMAACRACHNEIHRDPAAARRTGLLAPKNQWNQMPK